MKCSQWFFLIVIGFSHPLHSLTICGPGHPLPESSSHHSPHALSDKGKEAVKQLEAAMLEEAKAEKSKDGDPASAREDMKLAMLPRLREILLNVDSPQFLDAITQITVYFNSEEVQKNLASLQVAIRAERQEAAKSALADISEMISRAGKAVREAKTAADLDGTIIELGTCLGKSHQRNTIESLSEDVRSAFYRIDPTLKFVIDWQNYLAAKAAGDGDRARNALQKIASNNDPYLIPRSQILDLLKSPQQSSSKQLEEASTETDIKKEASTDADIKKILSETKSLADLENSLDQLRTLQNSRAKYRGNDPINSLQQNLQPLNKTYQDFKAGLSVNLDLVSSNNGNPVEIGTSVIARLKSELVLLLLPRYVGAPEGSLAKPDEDVIRFLERLISEAKARGNINVGIRAREALRLLQRGNNFSGTDTTSFTSYVAAQNQEVAGQYMLAVVSYQSALRGGSDLIPAKIIGERLAAIRAEHPKEYEAGMERFLNPPASQYPGRTEMRSQGTGYPSMGSPNRLPDSGANQPNPPPVLLIPPAPVGSPTPAPTAPPDN